jgi:transcriptional regulator with XRE-family HTH domain
MKAQPRVIVLKVRDVMREKNVTVADLKARTDLDERTIRDYRDGVVKRPTLEVLAKLAGGLGVPITRLFAEIEQEDLRSAMLRCGEVIIHKSSRTLQEVVDPGRPDHDPRYAIRREFLSTWDEQAGRVVDDYVNGFGIRARSKWHPWKQQASAAQHLDDADEISNGLAHVLLGSPVTSGFGERTTSWLFGVPPFQPANAGRFPYSFLWPGYRDVASAFGTRSPNDEYGILCNTTGKVVARRVLIESGKGISGADGGLIVVSRVLVKGPTRNSTGEGLVIVLLGLSGPGTLACAEVLCDPKNAGALYPPNVGEPIMRAVACEYTREGDADRDDRVLVPNSARLVALATAQAASCKP